MSCILVTEKGRTKKFTNCYSLLSENETIYCFLKLFGRFPSAFFVICCQLARWNLNGKV